MPQVSLKQAWITQELPQICVLCCCPLFLYGGEPRLTFGQFQNSGLEICAAGASPTRGGEEFSSLDGAHDFPEGFSLRDPALTNKGVSPDPCGFHVL